jgi:branched-chain amino acid transport system permease protein
MPELVSGKGWLVASQAVALAIAALSLNLLLGYAGQISLGHAGLLGAGAFASGIVTSEVGLTMWWGLLIAPAVGAALAFLVGLPALRLKGLYLALATVVFGLMMQYSVLRSSWLGGGSAGIALPRRTYGENYLTDNAHFLVVCLVALVLVWVLDENVLRSRLGRGFRMIREDESIAQSFGIPVVRYKLMAFVLSGAVAGLSGALYGHAIGFVNNETFGLLPSLLLITMVVVGGQGHRLAVVLMSVLFILFPTWLPMMKGWEVVIGGVVLMLTVARHPEGMADLVAHGRAKPRRGHVEDVRALPMLPTPPTRISDTFIPPGAPLLEVQDIVVTFGGLRAVDGAGFTVPQGKIVGLIGPNGAGKSTLFNAVTGMVPTASGSVYFAGEPIHRLSPDRRARLGIARSFQHLGLAKDLSVHGNLMLAQHLLADYGDFAALLRSRKVGRVEAELSDAADRALETLDFQRFRDRPVKQLSGGQQRIVEIASLLLTAPELIMLDEPTAGMAPGVTENLAERLRQLRDDFGRTVLIIEHNIPLVLDTCDEVYVLDAGKVIAHGDPREIVRDERVVAAYFGSRGRV